jgi:hypothetical protein
LVVAAGGYIWQQWGSTEWLLPTDAIQKFVPADLVQDWETKKQTENTLTCQLQKLSSGYLHGENPPTSSSLNIEVQKAQLERATQEDLIDGNIHTLLVNGQLIAKGIPNEAPPPHNNKSIKYNRHSGNIYCSLLMVVRWIAKGNLYIKV